MDTNLTRALDITLLRLQNPYNKLKYCNVPQNSWRVRNKYLKSI